MPDVGGSNEVLAARLKTGTLTTTNPARWAESFLAHLDRMYLAKVLKHDVSRERCLLEQDQLKPSRNGRGEPAQRLQHAARIALGRKPKPTRADVVESTKPSVEASSVRAARAEQAHVAKMRAAWRARRNAKCW